MSPSPRLVLVEARVHGRCLLLPADQRPPRVLVVGFHGYAETAEEHLAQLRGVPEAGAYCLAAVQALHPFYRRRTGEIGASWMTRQDRQRAIADNVAYVDQAVDEILAAIRPAAGTDGEPPLVYLGFSQGASMAWRAAVLGHRRCAGIVALAGDMPADLGGGDLSSLPPALIAQGRDDEWYDDAKRQADVDRLQAAGAQVESLLFAGGHEWHKDFYAALGVYLETIAASGDAG